MLITDKKNRNYAYVTMDDILNTITISDENTAYKLKNLFNSLDYNDDKIRINKNSEIYEIIKNSRNVIDGDTYINPTMLAHAYTRASIEFNYEMRDRLFKYLKRYIDNIAENKDNEFLVQKILCDDKTMNYVHKYETFEDYTKYIIGTRIKKHSEQPVQKQETKNRSFVKIAN